MLHRMTCIRQWGRNHDSNVHYINSFGVDKPPTSERCLKIIKIVERLANRGVVQYVMVKLQVVPSELYILKSDLTKLGNTGHRAPVHAFRI